MAGILGYLSILADDISTLAGKTIVTASTSLATSLDDIGILFDDIVTYTKLASVKSSGLLVDDLAAISSFTNETTSDILKKELAKAGSITQLKQNIKNLDKKSQKEILYELTKIKNLLLKKAQKNAAKRELPIVYKIAKGSFKNKIIIIPTVLILSAIAPWIISPALILGGIYLSYEGVEVILEKLFNHKTPQKNNDNLKNITNEEFENNKVKSAIKTDFILSFEIIVIAYSLLMQSEFLVKIIVLILIGIITTVGVYGVVALIIKLDDIGFYLQEKTSTTIQTIGNLLVKAMPGIIKIISIIGTIAMLAVGGGIIAHETHALHFFDDFIKNSGSFSWIISFSSEIILGLLIGFCAAKLLPLITPIIKKIKIDL